METQKLSSIPSYLGFNLIEWKILFGQIFLFNFDGKYYAFRPLTIKECEALFSLVDHLEDYIIDEWVVNATILTDNKEYLLGDAPAGIVAVISNSLLAKSYTKDIEEILSKIEKERESKSSLINVIDYLIKVGAGNLLKDTKNLTYKQQIQYLVFSEEVTGKKFELKKQTLPSNKSGRNVSPEVAAILSKEAADIPNFIKDNAEMRNL